MKILIRDTPEEGARVASRLVWTWTLSIFICQMVALETFVKLAGIMNRKSKKVEGSIYRYWELEQMGTSVSTNLPVHWLRGPRSRFSVNRPCVIMQYILIVPRMFHITL